MPDRIALKRLAASDLTFFETLFRRLGVGNQKSININADVFTGELYPDLADVAVEVPLTVTVWGPGTAGAYEVARSVRNKGKRAAKKYRNWRLNGSAVPDPPDEPGRFDRLRPGDIAVMEFTGDPQPSRLTLILVAAVDNPMLHNSLVTGIPRGRESMIRVTRVGLAALVDRANVEANHPVIALADPSLEADLEEAALGSASATRRLRRRSGRQITAEDLKRAQANAERVGSEGEAWAAIHLGLQRKTGVLSEVIWTSQTNAGAPWDFEVTTAAGEIIRIDAKSTGKAFGQKIHISAAEFDAAAHEGIRYDIMRLYDMNRERARIRVAADIGPFAKDVVDGLGLPYGVEPDGFLINPDVLTWGQEETVERPEEPS